ncbi:MAG: DNA-3-methyladenine glycosylase family protein [Calditrichia bacterium]
MNKISASGNPLSLNKKTFNRAIRMLTRRDSSLGRIVETLGPPPMWRRPAEFSTLVRIILEQQVSLASAKATYQKLIEKNSPLTPEKFLRLNDQQLKGFGFSRQKSRYCRLLAAELVNGDFGLEELKRMTDEQVRASLMQMKGIGPWTADIYLLMALNRPDAWPSHDLALAMALQKLKELDLPPSVIELEEFGEAWKPWRAVAARILWHFYLSPAFKSN